MSDKARAVFRHVPIAHLSGDELLALSKEKKLSLSREDMLAVQKIFKEENREPTDVELEVIAQTWSEHCKHRIFGARIEHSVDGKPEVVDGLFKTYVKAVTERILEKKPDFVLSAFKDNAGFVKLDDELAVCLKVETHNHPSAIEPYAGANTGLGGVIRDILGAGKGAKPIASLDVFCFGPPDTKQEDIKAKDVIHPLGIMRGVVRGVRDYGNRMGIPTTSGAIAFDKSYIYNPLVFCGTMGVIPIKDIDKEVKPGHVLIAAGGRTGRDGLKGATFSSVSLTTASHEEDQTAVQIGNPIEEKKVCDFILAAREQGLIQFVTDCGAGGFSSAAGEMLSECGGEVWLENAPLKVEAMESWQVFISESQERMVIAIEEKDLPQMQKLADVYETEICVLARADGSGILKVKHYGEEVCRLDCRKLHEAPRRHMKGEWNSDLGYRGFDCLSDEPTDITDKLRKIMSSFAIVSREPIIREYDHEVQGNTLLKPLAGATGDAPQDGSVIQVDGSKQAVAMSVAMLPQLGKTDPHFMGRACVDECVRQLVAMGADPDRIAILDNFCVGNPNDPRELGALVECCKGMAQTAEAYGTPFISGKDSFYNYFKTDEGEISIPVTLLVSGFGIVEDPSKIVGASVRAPGHKICLLEDGLLGGLHCALPLRGSVASTIAHDEGTPKQREVWMSWEGPPDFSENDCAANYRGYHDLVRQGIVLSAHDVGEGGIAVALAEMAFSGKAGIRTTVPANHYHTELFAETPGRIVFEVAAEHAEAVEKAGFKIIGETTADLVLHIEDNLLHKTLIHASTVELKALWKDGLTRYY
jgi:phosphoribosylformylglycinamidine synthase II